MRRRSSDGSKRIMAISTLMTTTEEPDASSCAPADNDALSVLTGSEAFLFENQQQQHPTSGRALRRRSSDRLSFGAELQEQFFEALDETETDQSGSGSDLRSLVSRPVAGSSGSIVTRVTRSGEFSLQGDTKMSLGTSVIQPLQRKTNSLSDFTINRLNLENLGLFGRDEEIAILREKLKQIKEQFAATQGREGEARQQEDEEEEKNQQSSQDDAEKTKAATPPPESPRRASIATMSSSDLQIGNNNSISKSKSPRRASLMAMSSEPQNTATSNTTINQKKTVCFLSGMSGTGKSSLARHSLQPSQQQQSDQPSNNNNQSLFVDGKFEFSSSQPYVGIQLACGQVCGHILWQRQMGNTELADQVCRDILSQLSTELDLLFDFLPVLHEILDDYHHHHQDMTSTSTAAISSSIKTSPMTNPEETSALGNSEETKNRFHYVFSTFLRIVASHFPLIIVLDDIQWCDTASLHLLEVLIADRQPFAANIMLVGIYRSNEVLNNLVFREMLQDTRKKGANGLIDLTELELGNLPLPAVHSLVSKAFRTDDDMGNKRISSLSELCMNKTLGNPFHLLYFLMTIFDNGLVTFNMGTLQWEWDETQIEEQTQATDNVVDLLQAKMQKEFQDEADLTRLVKVAACLGSHFEVHTLRLLWSAEETPTEGTTETPTTENPEGEASGDKSLLTSLDELVNEGYLVAVTRHHQYHWAHDNIQLAALSLVDEDARPAFCHSIGTQLETKLDEKALEQSLFVVVNLLNTGTETSDRKQRVKIARLNFRASQKALGVSAFQTAASYASKGIEQMNSIGDSAWTHHAELMLGLHESGARAEGATGNTQTMEDYCAEVIMQDDLDTTAKLDIYLIWIDSILNQGNPGKAGELCLEVLAQFNCRISKNPVSVLMAILGNVISIKKTMKSLNTSDIQKLEDPTRIKLVHLLDQCSTCLYLDADDRLPLIVFRNLNWTMEYGYCEYSPIAFATTSGILTGVLNDLQGGALYGEHALALVKKTTSKGIHARVTMIVYGIVFCWTKPMRAMQKPLLLGYDNGLKSGDTESAMWCIYLYVSRQFWVGTSLQPILDNIVVYSSQMRDLKRIVQATACDVMRQALWKLTGYDSSLVPTSQLHGEILSEEDVNKFEKDKALVDAVYQWRGIVCTYFGHHVEAADDVIRHGHDFIQKVRPASVFAMWDACLKGVSCFAAAKQTGKTKYRKMANVLRSKVKKWVAAGNMNIRHMDQLLEAEWHASTSNKTAAPRAYESAILLSAKEGYQHHSALASERLGEFHLHFTKDVDEAKYRIEEAIKYWREFGAFGKAEALEQKYADIQEIVVQNASKRPKVTCAMRMLGTGTVH